MFEKTLTLRYPRFHGYTVLDSKIQHQETEVIKVSLNYCAHFTHFKMGGEKNLDLKTFADSIQGKPGTFSRKNQRTKSRKIGAQELPQRKKSC